MNALFDTLLGMLGKFWWVFALLIAIKVFFAWFNSPNPAVSEGDNPLCGGEMVLRKRKSDGKPFYGCKRYPACRGIKNVE